MLKFISICMCGFALLIAGNEFGKDREQKAAKIRLDQQITAAKAEAANEVQKNTKQIIDIYQGKLQFLAQEYSKLRKADQARYTEFAVEAGKQNTALMKQIMLERWTRMQQDRAQMALRLSARRGR